MSVSALQNFQPVYVLTSIKINIKCGSEIENKNGSTRKLDGEPQLTQSHLTKDF